MILNGLPQKVKSSGKTFWGIPQPIFYFYFIKKYKVCYFSLQIFLFDEILVFKKKIDIAMEQAKKKRIGNHSNIYQINKPMGTLSFAEAFKLGNICGYYL